MAIRFASEAWRTNLESGHPSAKDFRFYIDFRQQAYPHQDGTPTFTAITAVDNQPGSHNLTGGYASYLLDMPTSFTVAIRCKPTFAYDVVADQPLLSWYVSATQYFTILYTAADNKITVKYKDGTNERTMKTSAYANNGALQVWHDLCVVADLANSDGLLYVNRAAVASDWSAAADVKATNFPKLEVRSENGTAGAWTINYVRLFPSKEATAAEVLADFSTVLNEEVYWPYNGTAVGGTRCNVTTFVDSFDYDTKVERPDNGAQCASSLAVTLRSRVGEFADDQTGAFDPVNSVYNGTTQLYMQYRCPIVAESWYANSFDPFFVGRLDSSCFSRVTEADGISRVELSAEDFVSELARDESKHGTYYEDHDLCDTAAETDSLVHELVRLVSKRSIYNYLANASFENATIADSWAVAGAGATFSKVAGGLFDSNQGDLVYGAATCTASQTVTFTGTLKLNLGDTYTFSIYLKSAAACAYNIYLAEADNGGEHDDTSAAWTLAGGDGWKRFSVTHTVTDATSDRLIAKVSLDDNVTLSLDGAMLTQGKYAHNWFVPNDNDGAAAVESADDADPASYDLLGFDVDSVDIEHPWAVIAENENVWDPLKDIANATFAYRMGIGRAGEFKYKTPLATGYADPSSLLTLTVAREITSDLTDNINKIVIRGVKIVKDTVAREVWNWDLSSLKTSPLLWETLSDAEVFPSTTTYPEFWAKYADYTFRREGGTAYAPGTFHSITWPLKKVTGNDKDVEILGVKSPYMTYGATSNEVGPKIWKTDLTKSEDYTSRSAEAKVRLTNSTGANRYLWAWAIRGLLVRRFSGAQGWIHDRFVDYESVQRNGESTVEIANNYIVTLDQTNKLADLWHKWMFGGKHTYGVSIHGTRLYFEPGEWYTFTIGGAGQAENINVTVMCESVRVNGSPSTIGETEVMLREVEKLWTFDSNATARFVASGRLNDNTPNNAVVVASPQYAGPADFYCSGTGNHAVINSAIDVGRPVVLTEGLFKTTDAIVLHSGAELHLRAECVIEKTGACNGVEAIGVSTAHLSDIKVTGYGKIIGSTSDDTSDTYTLVRCEYVDDPRIQNITADNGNLGNIYLVECDGAEVDGCRSLNSDHGGISVSFSDKAVVHNNFVEDCGGTAIVVDGDEVSILDNFAVNNNVGIDAGLNSTSHRLVLSANRCYNNTAQGIILSSNCINPLVASNYCFCNGNDTDIANTSDNFHNDSTSAMVDGNSWQ